MSVRDWYYCRECEVYGHGDACWCCGSTSPQRAQLPRLDDKRLVSERMSAALDRARELASGTANREPLAGRSPGAGPDGNPEVPVRHAS